MGDVATAAVQVVVVFQVLHLLFDDVKGLPDEVAGDVHRLNGDFYAEEAGLSDGHLEVAVHDSSPWTYLKKEINIIIL